MMPPGSLSTVPAEPGRVRSADEPAQRGQRPVGDLLYRPGGIDAQQRALIGVEGDQRLGLLLIHIQPVPDGLLAVIVSLEELAAAVIALAGPGRRVECRMPDPAAPAAGPPAGQPPDHFIMVDNQL